MGIALQQRRLLDRSLLTMANSATKFRGLKRRLVFAYVLQLPDSKGSKAQVTGASNGGISSNYLCRITLFNYAIASLTLSLRYPCELPLHHEIYFEDLAMAISDQILAGPSPGQQPHKSTGYSLVYTSRTLH